MASRLVTSPWAAVALVVAFIAAVVTLTLFHVDATAVEAVIAAIVVPLLGVLLQQMSQVKHQTNGNTSALIQHAENLRADNLALAHAVVDALSASVTKAPAPAPAPAPDPE